MALRIDEPIAATPERFDEFYALYATRVRALIGSRTRDRHLAEDLVQETFLRAHQNAGRYDSARPVWPWLATIATNVMIDSSRRRACRAEHLVAIDGERISDGSDASEQFRGRERRRAIFAVLDAMPARQRRVLVLRELEELHYDELAEREGLSIDGVKSLLKRARESFRRSYLSLADERGLLGAAVIGVRSLRDRFRERVATKTHSATWWANEMRTLPEVFSATVIAVLAAATVGVGGTVAGTGNAPSARADVIGHVADAPAPVANPSVAGGSLSSADRGAVAESLASGTRAGRAPIRGDGRIDADGPTLDQQHKFRANLPGGLFVEWEGELVTSCDFNAVRAAACAVIREAPHEVGVG